MTNDLRKNRRGNLMRCPASSGQKNPLKVISIKRILQYFIFVFKASFQL